MPEEVGPNVAWCLVVVGQDELEAGITTENRSDDRAVRDGRVQVRSPAGVKTLETKAIVTLVPATVEDMTMARILAEAFRGTARKKAVVTAVNPQNCHASDQTTVADARQHAGAQHDACDGRKKSVNADS